MVIPGRGVRGAANRAHLTALTRIGQTRQVVMLDEGSQMLLDFLEAEVGVMYVKLQLVLLAEGKPINIPEVGVQADIAIRLQNDVLCQLSDPAFK